MGKIIARYQSDFLHQQASLKILHAQSDWCQLYGTHQKDDDCWPGLSGPVDMSSSVLVEKF